MKFAQSFCRTLPALALLAAGTCLTPNAADAAGFYIQEQSVSGLGAAFAGQAATPRDASVLFFNPAAITQLPGTNINAGVHVLIGEAELTDTGTTAPPGIAVGPDGDNPFDPAAVPNLYLTHQVTDSLWLGIGVGAPFGLGNEYDDNAFNRYDAIESSLQTVEVYPTIAYQFNDWLSIGGSLIYQYVDVKLTNAAWAGTEGLQTLTADGRTFGYNVGIYAEPIEGTQLGIDYRSRTNTELQGRLLVQGSTGADVDISGSSGLHLPDIATFSAAQELNEQWKVMGSATWFGWNSFEDIQVRTAAGTLLNPPVIQNYQTTWAYSIGAEYEYNDTWTFRAGYQFDETPTTDLYRTSRTPDGDRNWFTGGFTYTLDDQWSFDFAGAYIDIADEEINVSRNNGLANVQADTEGHVFILSTGLNYKF